ncbi:MAG TPA: MarR family transcriptional regulator [Deltaproteobacteria bacterium]|nr:MarR family transcriptional regulator [Deltaproteobacteria bacterium]HPR54282.1 MarR family transcriptional regulator [Deltaproteobacteria bacterium]HXK45806.1 MarR family transcriptional regulator [Deltaproteobacteria bacterium]
MELSPVLLVQCLDEPLQTIPPETPRDSRQDSYSFRILMSLRHIMHFVDSYSRQLATEYQITGPQLVCLYAIVKNGPLTLSELGKQVSLSMSTANGIIDRLEQKKLVQRERKHQDRRKVLITATDNGRDLSSRAPLPLQGRLIKAISEMPELEQISVALSLERILSMMKEEE